MTVAQFYGHSPPNVRSPSSTVNKIERDNTAVGWEKLAFIIHSRVRVPRLREQNRSIAVSPTSQLILDPSRPPINTRYFTVPLTFLAPLPNCPRQGPKQRPDFLLAKCSQVGQPTIGETSHGGFSCPIGKAAAIAEQPR